MLYLTTVRGAALYIGALLGPGLLLLPGLAVAAAGPASLVAWVVLLIVSAMFATVFGAFGRAFPTGGGVIGYVRAGLGARAGSAVGWAFLAGVMAVVPTVCLVGGGYVAQVTGGGRPARVAIGGFLFLIVLILAAGGLRVGSTAQLLLVGLLVVLISVAVAGAVRSARLANWIPFAPHGWLAIGHAATVLMMSFIGWEAVAPLTTRFANPSRQLPQVIGAALAVTTVVYLALAIATIAVLGTGAATIVPLTGLLRVALGPVGTVAAAAAAIVLTLGSTNAYMNGAATMARFMIAEGRSQVTYGEVHHNRPTLGFLAAAVVSAALLMTLYGLGLISPAALVTIPTALFLVVYLGSMISAIRVLRGHPRVAAVVAAAAVVVMLCFCGWALAAPAAVVIGVFWPRRARWSGAGRLRRDRGAGSGAS